MSEDFFTHAQLAAAFPGVTEDQFRIMAGSGSENWPEILGTLPEDFDYQFLRRLGFPCGFDTGRVRYALMPEASGWRIWQTDDLLDVPITRLRRESGTWRILRAVAIIFANKQIREIPGLLEAERISH